MIAHEEYWNDVPPLGRAGRRWVRRRLYRVIQDWLKKQTNVDPENPENGPLICALVCELAAKRTVLSWQDAETFSGRGFSSGHYVFKTDVVVQLLPNLFVAITQRLDATDFPDLDKWLDAMHRDVLCSPAPAEPSSWIVLEGSGVRICRSCQSAFTIDRWNAVRCPDCRHSPTRRAPAKEGSE